MNEDIQQKGTYELLIQGTIRVTKLYLENLMKYIWEKCLNCNDSGNFILIQKTACDTAKYNIGLYDEIQCQKCGYIEDITVIEAW
jgi:hypothetical protein